MQIDCFLPLTVLSGPPRPQVPVVNLVLLVVDVVVLLGVAASGVAQHCVVLRPLLVAQIEVVEVLLVNALRGAVAGPRAAVTVAVAVLVALVDRIGHERRLRRLRRRRLPVMRSGRLRVARHGQVAVRRFGVRHRPGRSVAVRERRLVRGRRRRSVVAGRGEGLVVVDRDFRVLVAVVHLRRVVSVQVVARRRLVSVALRAAEAVVLARAWALEVRRASEGARLVRSVVVVRRRAVLVDRGVERGPEAVGRRAEVRLVVVDGPVGRRVIVVVGRQVGLAAPAAPGASARALAVLARRRTAGVPVALVVVVVGVEEQHFVAPVRTRVDVHPRERNVDQLADALATARWIQAIVEAFAHEPPLSGALRLAIFDALASQRSAHQVRRNPLAGQRASEASCGTRNRNIHPQKMSNLVAFIEQAANKHKQMELKVKKNNLKNAVCVHIVFVVYLNGNLRRAKENERRASMLR